jgi:hypothetical protein
LVRACERAGWVRGPSPATPLAFRPRLPIVMRSRAGSLALGLVTLTPSPSVLKGGGMVPSPGGHRAPTMIPPGLSIAPLRRSQCCSPCILCRCGARVAPHRRTGPPAAPGGDSCQGQPRRWTVAAAKAGPPGAVGSAASTALTLIPWVRGSGFANSATQLPLSRRGQRDGRFLVSRISTWIGTWVCTVTLLACSSNPIAWRRR